jgi:hypothetical protein
MAPVVRPVCRAMAPRGHLSGALQNIQDAQVGAVDPEPFGCRLVEQVLSGAVGADRVRDLLDQSLPGIP